MRFFKPKKHFEYTSAHAGWFFDLQTIIKKDKTKWQKILVAENPELGKTLLLDGITQLTEAGEYQYHEPMAHIPLLSHPKPERVLIIGGGDGGLARDVLRHSTIKTLDLVDLDEGVIEFSKKFLPELGGNAFLDTRLNVHVQDGRAFVKKAIEDKIRYDVILMDMTDPFGPSLALYSREFFALIRKLFATKDSLFIMHSESPDLRPRVFAKIFATLKAEFESVEPIVSHVRMYGGLWSWALCSAKQITKMNSEKLTERMGERGIKNLKIISAETWNSLFTLWPIYQTLLEKENLPEPASDANPSYGLFA